jgi:hypothetical protein
METAVNAHSFTPVTYTVHSDTRFDRYRILNSGYDAELIPDRTDR